MKPGTLVIHRIKDDVLHLTPVEVDLAEDLDNWIEWNYGEYGIVLDVLEGQAGIRVFVPRGIGLCFHDELVWIDAPAS